MQKFMFFISFVFGTLYSSQSYGFLENATHGYSNCMTCHYSPSGGDMLNDYGRSLSSEMMSTWTTPGVENSFGGLYKESKWARLGGDLRSLQRYRDTPTSEDRELFLMQNNIEVGLKHKGLMLIGTLGSLEGPGNTPSEFISERHYVLAELNTTSRLRAGKFRVNYGINDPNHNRLIKRSLGFGSYSETYNIEYSKFFDNWDISTTYSMGRVDRRRRNNDERSLSTKISHYLNGKSKVGVSLLYGETPQRTRELVGAFGITPLTEKSYVVYEVDYENQDINTAAEHQKTLLSHLRVGYEFFKGFKGYGIYDFQQNLENSNTRIKAPGLGFQWLPYPHLELQVEYQSLNASFSPGSDHFGFIMFHAYY